MSVISSTQIMTMFLFMGLLGLLWLTVRLNRNGLTKKFGVGRRITVSEVTAIGPQDRAMILTVDRREYLVLRLRGAPPVITELAPAPAPDVATEATA